MSNRTPTLSPPARPVDPCDILLGNDTLLSRLATEIARDLYPIEQVLACYSITQDQYRDQICDHPAFMTFYAEARSIWGAATSAPQRVALKSGILFEQWLEEADKLLHDPNSPMADKVKLGSYLSRLAGFENVNPPPARDGVVGAGAGQAATHVTINLNHGRKIEIKKDVVDAQLVEAEVTEIEQLRATSGVPDAIPGYMASSPPMPVAQATEPVPPPPTPQPQPAPNGRKPEGEMRISLRGPTAITAPRQV